MKNIVDQIPERSHTSWASHNLKNECFQKMTKYLQTYSKMRSFESKSVKRFQKPEESPFLIYEKQEIPAPLVEMITTRRSLISLIKKSEIKSISPKAIEKIRQANLPKEYKQLLNNKKNEQKQKYLKDMISRNPLATAIYQVRALTQVSKKRIKSNLNSIFSAESRFKHYIEN